ncbi:MAG: DEAD/DEAH box helicase [Ignavibacteriales bacterium]|nr:DEAD/DEAH box helicase [Ignavibacteriales bacterium]
MYNLREINYKLFSEAIRLRGYSYFRDQRVESTKLTGNELHALVRGTASYNVIIRFDKLMYPYFRHCTCQYPEKGSCKHVAATLFQLNSIGFFNTRYYVDQIRTFLGVTPEEAAVLDAPRQPELLRKERKKPGSRGKTAKTVKSLTAAATPKAKEPVHSPEELQRLKEESERKLEELKSKEQLRLFRHRMDMLLVPEKKPSKTGYSRQYMISLHIENRMRSFAPIVVTLKKGIPSSVRLLDEKDLREAPELPGNLFMALLSTMDVAFTPFQFPTFQATFQTPKEEFINTIFARVLDLLQGTNIYYRTNSKQSAVFEKEAFISPVKGSAKVQIYKSEQTVKASLELEHPDFGTLLFKDAAPVTTQPMWFLYKSTLIKIDSLNYKQYLAFAVTDGELTVGGSHTEVFEREYIPVLPRHLKVDSDYYQYKQEDVTPEKRLYLTEQNESINIALRFGYGTEEVDSRGPAELRVTTCESITIFQRNKELELSAAEELRLHGLRPVAEDVFTPKGHPVDFLLDTLPLLREKGFVVLGESELENFDVITQPPSMRLKVSSGVDWFEVQADMVFGEELIPLSELLMCKQKEIRYVRLGNHKIVRLADSITRRLNQHTSLAEISKNGALRFSHAQAGAVMALLDEEVDSEVDEDTNTYLNALKNFSGIKPIAIPHNLKAELRPYQVHGFNWLCFLQAYRFGGILADDMGLGKTLQVLTLLLHEKNKGTENPSLIVAPTSVVFNWILEAAKFAPDLRILNHTGLERKNNSFEHFAQYDIIITSYGTILRDYEELSALTFHYIILDESQKIKNPVAKSSRLVRKLHAGYRLCLSGTPVENNLTELWSQMAFLNPGMLGSLQRFQDKFIKALQREDAESEMDYLRKLLYPFILRRTKDLVAKELPPKTEIIHYCEMLPEQARIYESVLFSVRSEVLEYINKKGIEKSGIKVIEALLRLRQVCNHPSLMTEHYSGSSGKFDEFKEMIVGVIEEGHKVLVFSQFVKMLEMMKGYLDRIGIPHEYLTGATKDRESAVRNFQENPDVRAMLISLKAGGFGLNLTSADNVFLYDPWWNPAVEQQAADRSHRIGQDKNVFIYKFITKGSVEEKILHLQENKRQLVEKILTTEKGLLKKLTKKDIDYLLG